MPDVTVYMRAHNSRQHVRAAIQSVLGQSGDLDLIFIDDGSTDETSTLVETPRDRRLTLIRNDRVMGAAHCLDTALTLSQSPFVVCVSADDFMLPDALGKMLQVFSLAPQTGLVHSYSFEVDGDGNTTREAFRRRRAYLINTRTPLINEPQAFALSEEVIDTFRAYNRAAVAAVGGITEKTDQATEYDLGLRLAKQFEIRLIPEFLYARRIRRDRAAEMSPAGYFGEQMRSVKRRWQLCRIRKLALADHNGHSPNLLADLSWVLSGKMNLPLHVRAARLLKGSYQALIWKVGVPIVRAFYRAVVTRLSWWPIGVSRRVRESGDGSRRLGYYLWQFPVSRRTSVNRELAALRGAGVSVQTFADEAPDPELIDSDNRSLLDSTHYLPPPDWKLFGSFLAEFLFKRPLRTLNLLFFVMTRRHGPHKSIKDDCLVFLKGMNLARVLQHENITHVHTPSVDQTAFIALVAARLAGISYTVQARTHNNHRKSCLYALADKLENAEFVITNTRYNQSYIESLVKPNARTKVFTIDNGIEVAKFKPPNRQTSRDRDIRLLCVASLIEQKGLVYLLEACRLLKDQGFSFTCEIVGGPAEPLYTNYFVQLKRLHRRLGLEDCVVFRGAQPFVSILEKYKDADIFVLPCVIARDGSRDITPTALIEAMAMKLPVISTAVTGVPELVEHGVSGLLVSPNDAQSLADAIIGLIEDEDVRIKLGNEARRQIEQRFDSTQNVKQRVDLFSRVLNAR